MAAAQLVPATATLFYMLFVTAQRLWRVLVSLEYSCTYAQNAPLSDSPHYLVLPFGPRLTRFFMLQGMGRHMAAALLIPATATLLYMLFVIIRPPVWYNPQYAVPLIGMLLGNALNGVTVGVKTFLETVSAERAAIEWALSMGATRFEAMQCAL